MLVPSLKKPAADFWEGKILGSRMEHPHRLSSQLLGWKIPYAFPWYWSISFKFHWNLEKPSHMVWESTQTTRETHNNEAANLSGSLSLPQCRFFSHKTVSPYWKNNIFVKWDAFFRTQIYVLICLSRFFLLKKPGFFALSEKKSWPAAIPLAALKNTAAYPVMPTSPLRNLAMRRRKNLYTKETPPNSKTGGKVQQHLIKSSSLWTSSANKNLEMMLLVMVIHEVLQLPTTPKKTRKFPLGTTLIPNPKPFFSSHHLQIIDPKFGNSVTRMLTRWSHHSKLLNLGDQQIFSPPTFCHLQNPEVDEMNLKHDYFTVVFQFFEYLWINIENPPGPSQPSAP